MCFTESITESDLETFKLQFAQIRKKHISELSVLMDSLFYLSIF